MLNFYSASSTSTTKAILRGMAALAQVTQCYLTIFFLVSGNAEKLSASLSDVASFQSHFVNKSCGELYFKAVEGLGTIATLNQKPRL